MNWARAKYWLRQFVYQAGCLAERLATGSVINLTAANFLADPYPHFARLRQKGPIARSLSVGGYWATDFATVQTVLLDKRFGADVRPYPKHAAQARGLLTDPLDLQAFDNPSMLTLDPPEHGRVRRLTTRAFTRRFIDSLAPRIELIVDTCLDGVGNQPSFDVVDVLAKPLPAIVIAEMMGLPKADHEQFQVWSEALIDATANPNLPEAEYGSWANRALLRYFERIIASRRDQPPQDDLIGLLMAAEEAGDKLNAVELYNNCLLLLVAGHETTTRLIGNAVHLLLTHPEALASLRDEPALMSGLVEETLRFDPPVQATQRFVREDLTLADQNLRRGDIVLVSIAGANRDPDVMAEPDRFDITRESIKQVSFGHGIHLCIGAHLARLEASIAITRLLERYPSIALDAEPPRRSMNPFFRGFEALHLAVSSPHSSAP
ncbi:MAG: cytochrome P450 [Pseudomonadota bacterium]